MALTSRPKFVVSAYDPPGPSDAAVVLVDEVPMEATKVGGPVEFQVGLEVWERQPDEDDKAWAYFSFYRDLPAFDRTIKNTYLHFFPTPAIAQCKGQPVHHWLNDIAQRLRWKDRVADYDRYQDEFFRSALLIERVRARKETAVLGTDMRRKAADALRYVQTTLTYEVMDPVTGEMMTEVKTVLTVKEILDLAKTGSDLEQTALDMKSESIVAQQVNIYVNDDDDQLLQAAKELLRAREMIDVTPTKVSS